MLDEFIHSPRVAYFSMEIALRSDIPTYAGGLGILAGDTMRSAADLRLPMVAVSLVFKSGYFHQALDASGRQQEQPMSWSPRERGAHALNAKVGVPIEGRTVWIGAWLYIVESQGGGRQPVLLLDTDLDDNDKDDRELTHYLYGGADAYRLKQEIVLGIGGVRMLHALGFRIRQYHLNEGHSALLTLELLRRHAYAAENIRPGEALYDVPTVRAFCNFTTHTPVEAGHDKFSYALVQRVLQNGVSERDVRETLSRLDGHIDIAMLKHLGGEDEMNMTRLALNLSEYVNGVAVRHAEISQRMFPGYQVHAITNGVHAPTWTCDQFRDLYDRFVPAWRHEPEQLVRADCCISDDALKTAHAQAKRALIENVKRWVGKTLDPQAPILGFARRMTAYKRPDLLFYDLDRLKRIAKGHPFQILLAGKAHPRDEMGKRLIELLHEDMRALNGAVAVTYLPDYDMARAQALVSGVDVWLNTPLPPLEASGTSGMKAAFNGVPSLSVLDGWWIEGCIEGITGWAITSDSNTAVAAEDLYAKLENVVLPLWYAGQNGDGGWIRVMKGAISKNASYFNSHRMMRRYAAEAYR